jgi:hypothetical protein
MRRAARQAVCKRRLTLHFHHGELALTGAAFRAAPIGGNIIPACAGRDALIQKSNGLVVDKFAEVTLPFFHRSPDIPFQGQFIDGAVHTGSHADLATGSNAEIWNALEPLLQEDFYFRSAEIRSGAAMGAVTEG